MSPPLPLSFQGGGHTRLHERERVWGSQFGRGDKHCGTLSILYLYFVVAICASITWFHRDGFLQQHTIKKKNFPSGQWIYFTCSYFKYSFLIRFKEIRGIIYFLYILLLLLDKNQCSNAQFRSIIRKALHLFNQISSHCLLKRLLLCICPLISLYTNIQYSFIPGW